MHYGGLGIIDQRTAEGLMPKLLAVEFSICWALHLCQGLRRMYHHHRLCPDAPSSSWIGIIVIIIKSRRCHPCREHRDKS
jgi:hypothetical protein